MTVSGAGAWIRNPGASSGLVSAKFFVTYPGSQDLGPNDSQYVIWDSVLWDDIGFPIDYSTSGSLYPPSGMDGEFWIASQIQLTPPSVPVGGVSGEARLEIAISGPPEGEQVTQELSSTTDTSIAVAGAQRIHYGEGFAIGISLTSADDHKTIRQATLYIVKLKSIPPL